MAERSTALETSSLAIRGVRAALRLEGGVITISREGDTVTAPSEISFEVTRVRGASLEAPPRGGRGWLHIAVVGGSPAPPGELAAVKDPYTLPLNSRGVGAAKKLERMIEKHIKARGKPTDQVANPGSSGSRVSVSSGVSVVRRATPAPEDAPKGPTAAPTRRKVTRPPGSDGRPPTRVPDAAADDPQDGHELVAALRELAQLHRDGALTDDEFQAAKRRLLR